MELVYGNPLALKFYLSIYGVDLKKVVDPSLKYL
jgi:hypothetical protein